MKKPIECSTQLFAKAHLLKDMRVDRVATWEDQIVWVCVYHKALGHTSRTWKMTMEDAKSDVMVSSVVAILAEELVDEIEVYNKLGDAK
jgi:hypothetical protein